MVHRVRVDERRHLRQRCNDPMRIRTPADVGALVRERRKAKKLDQRALAARVGVSREWIIDLEGGKPGASLGLVLRTLDALDASLSVDNDATSSRVRPATVRVPDIDAVVRAATKPRRRPR